MVLRERDGDPARCATSDRNNAVGHRKVQVDVFLAISGHPLPHAVVAGNRIVVNIQREGCAHSPDTDVRELPAGGLQHRGAGIGDEAFTLGVEDLVTDDATLTESANHQSTTTAATPYRSAWPVVLIDKADITIRSPGLNEPTSGSLLANSPVAVARRVGLLPATDQTDVPLMVMSQTVLPPPVPAVPA